MKAPMGEFTIPASHKSMIGAALIAAAFRPEPQETRQRQSIPRTGRRVRRPAHRTLSRGARPKQEKPARPKAPTLAGKLAKFPFTHGRSWLEYEGLSHLLPDPHTHAQIYACVDLYFEGGAVAFTNHYREGV